MGELIPFAVPFEDLVDYEANTVTDEDPVYEEVVRSLERERLHQLMGQLPRDESTAIRLRFGFDGEARNAAQVARAMDIRKGTALSLLRQGLGHIADGAHDLNPAA